MLNHITPLLFFSYNSTPCHVLFLTWFYMLWKTNECRTGKRIVNGEPVGLLCKETELLWKITNIWAIQTSACYKDIPSDQMLKHLVTSGPTAISFHWLIGCEIYICSIINLFRIFGLWFIIAHRKKRTYAKARISSTPFEHVENHNLREWEMQWLCIM